MFEYLEKYIETFNDGFPTMEVSANSDDEIVDMIKKCLDANKNAYEMGFAKRNDNLY